MSGVILDTNVLSELARDPPHPSVLDYVTRQENAWISTITTHELTYGIERLPDGARKRRLSSIIQSLLDDYSDRLLPIGTEEARNAALLRIRAEQQGQTLHLADALIAGTAMARGFAIATRNVSDFSGLAFAVIDPWSER